MNSLIIKTDTIKTSLDGTIKFAVLLKDGLCVESCILKLPYRTPNLVICVSSQVGCQFDCNFCRNGKRPFIRDLDPYEIIGQVELALNLIDTKDDVLFDVTYMGVGDPLMNTASAIESMNYLIKYYHNLNMINVSTVGSVDGLMAMLKSDLIKHMHLQLSLHTPFDSQRRKLISNTLPSIDDTIELAENVSAKSGKLFCVNYLLLKDQNDSQQHLLKLQEILKNRQCYVKISKYSVIKELPHLPSPQSTADKFYSTLKSNGFEIKCFQSYGQDIGAGCGQLVASNNKQQSKTIL